MAWRISFRGTIDTIKKAAEDALKAANYGDPIVKVIVDAALAIIDGKKVPPNQLITVDAAGGSHAASSGKDGHSLNIVTGGVA